MTLRRKAQRSGPEGSNPATLVTMNPDGSSQVSVVWIMVQRTADGEAAGGRKVTHRSR